MASLPTIDDYTDEQLAYILSVFGSESAYEVWLRDQVAAHVASTELAILDEAHRVNRQEKYAEVQALLAPPE